MSLVYYSLVFLADDVLKDICYFKIDDVLIFYIIFSFTENFVTNQILQLFL